MDLKAVGQRIKSAREAKNLTQEEVVAHSVTGVTNELTEKIEKLPIKEQKKMIKVIHTLLEE